jgi:UDP-glucose 4-epimerase
MKQVPTCEYHPAEAFLTNAVGAQNIVRAISEHHLPVETVVGISTDKAVKPVNVMGMTKALQERILLEANLQSPRTRFVVARYGNVLASRGSVIPLFKEQIEHGGPITLTTPEMTRFLLSLEEAVDTVFAAVRDAVAGETWIPLVPTARVVDVAKAMIGERAIELDYVGIRPGEKVHEVLVSEEEAPRTYERGDYLAIQPILPELRPGQVEGAPFRGREYSSADNVADASSVAELLRRHGMIPGDPQPAR